MKISLTAELERFVNEKVESGAYSSASAVIREGLRLLKERDEQRRVSTEEMRRDIVLGAEQIREGRGNKYGGATELAAEIKRRVRQLGLPGHGGAE